MDVVILENPHGLVKARSVDQDVLSVHHSDFDADDVAKPAVAVEGLERDACGAERPFGRFKLLAVEEHQVAMDRFAAFRTVNGCDAAQAVPARGTCACLPRTLVG